MPKGVTVTDDGNRLRVTASASDWSGLWPILAEVKPLVSCQWEGIEQAAGQRTSVWVR
jgi:hypothetical protein